VDILNDNTAVEAGNDKDAVKYPNGVTAEMVKGWKAANKNGIAEIESGEFKAYIRRPSRNDMRELSAQGKSTDPVTYTEIILDLLWLGGDEQIRTDDAIFFGAMDIVQDVLDVQSATLKKL
jgi:hypothetical protein